MFETGTLNLHAFFVKKEVLSLMFSVFRFGAVLSVTKRSYVVIVVITPPFGLVTFY